MQQTVFQFPPSVQSDLFQYLKQEQQEFLKPILRILKPKCQEELCVSLIDYLETGVATPPETFSLGVIFWYVINQGFQPLHYTEPKHIGTIIKQFFNH